MIDAKAFVNLPLRGGFIIAEIAYTSEAMTDALGREVLAQTTISGQKLRLRVAAGLSDEELSVTMYHELLEAAAVASSDPPASVTNLTEAGFERAARQMHQSLGEASPENINRMLQICGFRGE